MRCQHFRHPQTCRSRWTRPGSLGKLSPRCHRHMQRLAASPTDVFVLDFDGVLIDSEPEISACGYAAAEHYWPELFSGVTDAQQVAVRAGLKKVRPVLVSGHETLVMVRLLLEDPANADLMLKSWESMFPKQIQEWQLDEADMKNYFETYRNEMMTSNDGRGWLAMHEAYPGVKEALSSCSSPFYIASSKAAHRVSKLMASHFGQDIPVDSPRLFSGLIPPNERKIQALRQILQRPICANARLHFVDDRLETLLAVAQTPDLAARCSLYLADWGYNTAEQRQEARSTKAVTSLSLNNFCEFLKWGLLMGVDDGCEPTAEEVAAGVLAKSG